MIYRAYFDRNPHSIDGVFSLQAYDQKAGKLQKPFNRLPARSGQRGHTLTDWTRSKSPTPFGKHLLWLQSVHPGEDPGASGIGEFFPISSSPANKRIIQNPENPKLIREDIGLHGENSKPGSAGCVVLLMDTPERKIQVKQLFVFLRELGRTQQHIELIVL